MLGALGKLIVRKRLSFLSSTQGKKPFLRNGRTSKESQTRAKRLAREMTLSWKRNEKEERDVRKRVEKEALDRIKVEEENREAARQTKKLEFLISQTELYSHFFASKLASMCKLSTFAGETFDLSSR